MKQRFNGVNNKQKFSSIREQKLFLRHSVIIFNTIIHFWPSIHDSKKILFKGLLFNLDFGLGIKVKKKSISSDTLVLVIF